MNGLTRRSERHQYGPVVNADHYLYRCYDADGLLLYIGCTSNVSRRIAAHRSGAGQAVASRWLSSAFMVRHEVVGPFAGREAGRDAERLAIHLEQPLFNYQERANAEHAAWMTRAAVARYLVERDRLDLALETVCLCWRETRQANGFDSWCVAHMAAAELWLESHGYAERGAA